MKARTVPPCLHNSLVDRYGRAFLLCCRSAIGSSPSVHALRLWRCHRNLYLSLVLILNLYSFGERFLKAARDAHTRVIQLVLSLGRSISALFLRGTTLLLRNLYPQPAFRVGVCAAPSLACLLPLSWAYAFWHIPEDARIAPLPSRRGAPMMAGVHFFPFSPFPSAAALLAVFFVSYLPLAHRWPPRSRFSLPKSRT